MVERTGTDARFSFIVRQNVVIGLIVFPLREQEVAGSNPVAPTGKIENLATIGGGVFCLTRHMATSIRGKIQQAIVQQSNRRRRWRDLLSDRAHPDIAIVQNATQRSAERND